MQAGVRYPAPLILHSLGKGDQFGPIAGARLGPEADLFRQQGIAGAGDEIPGLRESGLSGGILNKKTPPLLPKLHRDGDDRPFNLQSFAKIGCDGKNGARGSGTVGIRHTLQT